MGRLIPGRFRYYQNEAFCYFILRGGDYQVVLDYINILIANTDAMNSAICLGWHSLLWYTTKDSELLME